MAIPVRIMVYMQMRVKVFVKYLDGKINEHRNYNQIEREVKWNKKQKQFNQK